MSLIRSISTPDLIALGHTHVMEVSLKAKPTLTPLRSPHRHWNRTRNEEGERTVIVIELIESGGKVAPCMYLGM
jgi:hypothetical protein